MRVVIISNGTISDSHFLKNQLKQGDTIICADGGYDHALKAGVHPDLLVGDLDSIQQRPTKVRTEQFSTHKDFTDTELALQYAFDMKADEIVFLGATGTRLDHTLANIFLLKRCLQQQLPAAVIDANNAIRLFERSISLTGKAGDIVSLVPLTPCTGVDTIGLEYVLHNADLAFGPSVGVSNRMLGEHAGYTMRSGLALVIQAHD